MKPRCRYGCRFLQITDDLYLCPHASWGASSYKVGAVEEARKLLERAGGYDAVLSKIVQEELERKLARDEARHKHDQAVQSSVRYG